MHKVTKNIFPIEWALSDDIPVPYHGKKVFGTFVCGGGSTMGYKLAGYDHIGGVEFTDHYTRVYKANHSPRLFYMEDIRDFNKRDDLPQELYELDLLDGSPPCAAFSTAGAREKLWGKKSEYEGKQQVKDDLVYVYCDTIAKLRPKVALLENVSGLIKGNAKLYAKGIVRRLKEIGYKPQVFLLYAASMGCPQKRPRVFFISFREDLDLPRLQLDFDCKKVNFDVTKKFWHLGGDSIRGFAVEKLWDEIDWPKDNSHPKAFGLCRPRLDDTCPTITEKSSDTSARALKHPTQKRALNREEVRILSTYPSDYNFLDIHPTSVMGRSVLPVMMANISHQIYKQWLSKI